LGRIHPDGNTAGKPEGLSHADTLFLIEGDPRHSSGIRIPD